MDSGGCTPVFFYAFPSPRTKTSTLMDARRDTRISFLSVKKQFYYFFFPSFGLEGFNRFPPTLSLFHPTKSWKEMIAQLLPMAARTERRITSVTCVLSRRGRGKKIEVTFNSSALKKKTNRRNNKANKLHGRLLFFSTSNND